MTTTASMPSRRLLLGSVPLLAGAALAAPAVTGIDTAGAVIPKGKTAKLSYLFCTASGSQATNKKMLQTWGNGIGALTFGFRVKPASKGSYPKAVQSAIGSRKVYDYAGGMDWVTQGSSSGLKSGDKKVSANGKTYVVLSCGGAAVVGTVGSCSALALVRAGKELGRSVVLGLPAPVMRTDVAYLPNVSYLGVLYDFTKRYAQRMRGFGAAGFYHHVEMPLRDTGIWKPVRDLYLKQNQAVAAGAGSGTRTIVSPYYDKSASNAMVTSAARQLWGVRGGTNMVIAPQDGLGVGSKTLSTTASAIKAVRAGYGGTVWSNIECMTPGGGSGSTRGVASRSRIESQFRAAAPAVTGYIAFTWGGRSGLDRVSGYKEILNGVKI